MSFTNKREAIRIRTEYARRDKTGLSQMIYRYTNPAFLFHMQEREWAILSLLRREGFELSGSSVLEVGCGNGHILQRFMEFGAREAMGVDLMETRIQDGKKRYPNLHLRQGNAALLPYQDSRFDLVMQFTCLSSVLDVATRQQIASEMWRVLRPGGVIVFYDLRPTPMFARFLNRTFHWLFHDPKWEQLDAYARYAQLPTPVRPLALSEIQELFSQGRMHHLSLSLDFDLAHLARTSRWFAGLLSCFQGLRTHYLVIVHKSLPDDLAGA